MVINTMRKWYNPSMDILAFLTTLPGASLMGIFTGLLKAHMQMRHEQELIRLKYDNLDLSNARMSTSKAMEWMRMFVIFFVCIAYFSKPFVAAIMHWPMWVAYTESHGILVSWFSGDESVDMRAYMGLVNSPVDNQVMIFLMSFLFGSMRVSRMQ